MLAEVEYVCNLVALSLGRQSENNPRRLPWIGWLETERMEVFCHDCALS